MAATKMSPNKSLADLNRDEIDALRKRIAQAREMGNFPGMMDARGEQGVVADAVKIGCYEVAIAVRQAAAMIEEKLNSIAGV
jgi:hypothetical protein